MRNFSKLTLGFLLVVLAFVSCASTESYSVGNQMEFIIEVPNKTKDQLYVSANAWAVDVFNSAEAVIEFSDKDAGIVKGIFSQEDAGFWAVKRYRTTITIEVKDSKARLVFSNPTSRVVSIGGGATNPAGWPWKDCDEKDLELLNTTWKSMATTFREALESESPTW